MVGQFFSFSIHKCKWCHVWYLIWTGTWILEQARHGWLCRCLVQEGQSKSTPLTVVASCKLIIFTAITWYIFTIDFITATRTIIIVLWTNKSIRCHLTRREPISFYVTDSLVSMLLGGLGTRLRHQEQRIKIVHTRKSEWTRRMCRYKQNVRLEADRNLSLQQWHNAISIFGQRCALKNGWLRCHSVCFISVTPVVISFYC